MSITERFLRYVAIDTQSDPDATCFPSTEKQKNLAKLLVEEMKRMGIADAFLDDFGYVYGSIPAVGGADSPAIGFIAHLDTSPDMPGRDIKPRIVKNYDGKDIVLNEALNIVSRVEELPDLKECVGHDLIVTDGTTLLGGDDKAGIACILEMADHFLKNPTIPHGPIKIAFTPDEEVGGGASHFDVKGFGAPFAYTVDSGGVGGIQYETFNAASAKVTVTGLSAHPGDAKNRMVNALNIAHAFHAMVPAVERPEHTEGREGFYHLTDLTGNVVEAELRYIIREHDDEMFQQRKQTVQDIAAYLNKKYGDAVQVEVTDSYRNMGAVLSSRMELVDAAISAVKEAGLTPQIVPVRGGTDGATLSFMGLPCPNLSCGSYCFHGRHEFASIQNMEASAKVLIGIVNHFATT